MVGNAFATKHCWATRFPEVLQHLYKRVRSSMGRSVGPFRLLFFGGFGVLRSTPLSVLALVRCYEYDMKHLKKGFVRIAGPHGFPRSNSTSIRESVHPSVGRSITPFHFGRYRSALEHCVAGIGACMLFSGQLIASVPLPNPT